MGEKEDNGYKLIDFTKGSTSTPVKICLPSDNTLPIELWTDKEV